MMSTATEFAPASLAGSEAPEAKKGKGIFRRMFEAMAAAQQARANRCVMGAMSQLPDHQLAELGFLPEQIDEIRSHRGRSAAWL
jgi:hypothetical protein